MSKIKIISGAGTGSEFVLGERTSLGRARECDVQVRDAESSRLHAEILAREGQFVLRDCGSSNGTLLNELRIHEAVLASGDQIRIGSVVMAFVEETDGGTRALPADADETKAGDSPAPDAEEADADLVLVPDEEPPTLAGYRIETLIRQDGPVAEYAGVELALERPVEVEWLREGGAGLPSLGSRIGKIARLEHPVFPRVFAAGVTAEGCYVVREPVQGVSMASMCGKLSPAEVLEIARQAAGGLAEAHAAGLVHGSLRPDRIVRTRKGHLKLLGLGLGTAIPAERGGSSSAKEPEHLAPEQFAQARPSASTDIYSLGAVLYHLLCGRPPYAGDREELKSAIVGGQFPRVLQLRPNTPKVLAKAIENMLARSPSDRPASMRLVAESLAEASPAAAIPPDRGADTSEVRVVRRSPAGTKVLIVVLTLLLMGAVLLLGKLGGVWFVEQGVDQAPTAPAAAR